MRLHTYIVVVTALLFQAVRGDDIFDCHSERCTTKETSSASKVLSRRKRFLIFPEGSSFQLVFCVQTSAVITIGDIFLYANTAALAWKLPTDPALLHMLKGEKAIRRGDMKEIYYLDEEGRVVATVPYKKSSVIKPIIAKRNVDDLTYKEKLQIKLHKQKMHEKQMKDDLLKKAHMNKKTVEFHRSGRVGLYEKLEKLLTTLGHDGKQCVLRKLCEAARTPISQGTFLQELLAIVFTLPKGKKFDEANHQHYDEAHNDGNDDCEDLYPGCISGIKDSTTD